MSRALETAFSLTKGFLRGIILLFHKMLRERFLFAIFVFLWYSIIVWVREGPQRKGCTRPWHDACLSALRSLALKLVGQDRQILTCSGAGAPELQRWVRGIPVGGTSLSRYAPHRNQEVSPTGKTLIS